MSSLTSRTATWAGSSKCEDRTKCFEDNGIVCVCWRNVFRFRYLISGFLMITKLYVQYFALIVSDYMSCSRWLWMLVASNWMGNTQRIKNPWMCFSAETLNCPLQLHKPNKVKTKKMYVLHSSFSSSSITFWQGKATLII